MLRFAKGELTRLILMVTAELTLVTSRRRAVGADELLATRWAAANIHRHQAIEQSMQERATSPYLAIGVE